METVIDARRRLREGLTREDAEHAIEESWRRQQERSRPRERGSGWRRGQPRCEVCRRFKPTPGGPCGSCGFEPARGFPG